MLLFNPKCRWRSAHPVADPRAGSRPPLAPAYSRSAGPSPGRQNRPGGPYNLSLFSVTGFLALFIPLFQQICDHQKNGRFPGGAGNFRIPANSPERFIRKPRRLRGQLTIYCIHIFSDRAALRRGLRKPLVTPSTCSYKSAETVCQRGSSTNCMPSRRAAHRHDTFGGTNPNRAQVARLPPRPGHR